jgi:hypothetical protein
MVDNKTLDGSYWGRSRPARPSNGGEVVIQGGQRPDGEGNKVPGGSFGDGRVMPRHGGMPGFGIFPADKDPSPRGT